MTDIKLPEPVAWMGCDGHPRHKSWAQTATELRIHGKPWIPLYTASQMRAAIAAERAALAQPAFSEPVVLPDGSAFAVASFPLPKDHWLYAPRGEWDSERDEYAECPRPILNHHEHRKTVIAAIRYAIRGATMRGQEMDFDPDALVQNACYALCGPFNSAAQPAEPAALTDEEIDEIPFWGFDAHYHGLSENEALRLFARAVERAIRGQQ